MNDSLFINMFRQRQLHQNAVDLVIFVQNTNQIQQLFLRCIFIHAVFVWMKSNFFAGTLLVTNINLRCWVIAHQNNCQPRHDAMIFS